MNRGTLIAILVGAGVLWGGTIPLSKIAVSTGYPHFGLLFWQHVFMIVFLLIYQGLRGRLRRYEWRHMPIMVAVAVLGTVFPGTVTYMSYSVLPGGMMAVIIAMVPIFALPLSIALGIEKPVTRRVLGVGLGLFAVVLLVGPQEALPVGVKPIFVMFALLAPLCWASEDNAIAKLGLGGLGANQVLLGASVIGLILVAPVTFATGQYINLWKPWTGVELAFLVSIFFHMVAYTTFIWFIPVAGPVMASQAAYLVTGFGIFFSVVFLDEGYSPYFWLAVGILAVSLYMVSPRRGEGHVVPANA
ncbi:MAG: DMT family transporter [Pseudomonadota bacterium]